MVEHQLGNLVSEVLHRNSSFSVPVADVDIYFSFEITSPTKNRYLHFSGAPVLKE